eukprot:TRINITY_DN19122_c0_g1_i1.p2 TRINITY_DN19122_c0_g1~~TRINITY_DN19122_c0_g1_i1.p2  ORF type:complete len:195 (+),score=39.83 TRINITY_DN19122_c0_g1_i1:174-758(+)
MVLSCWVIELSLNGQKEDVVDLQKEINVSDVEKKDIGHEIAIILLQDPEEIQDRVHHLADILLHTPRAAEGLPEDILDHLQDHVRVHPQDLEHLLEAITNLVQGLPNLDLDLLLRDLDHLSERTMRKNLLKEITMPKLIQKLISFDCWSVTVCVSVMSFQVSTLKVFGNTIFMNSLKCFNTQYGSIFRNNLTRP